MEKLSTQYNLHWSLLRSVASFLQGRAQVTSVGILVSAPLYLNGGIPQGTKLGPVLFAVMVNDLVQSWSACIKCVDDLTVLEVVRRNSPPLLNVVVDDIHAFTVNNNMGLNPRKCKSMTVDFLHYNSWVPRPIAVGGFDIQLGPVVQTLDSVIHRINHYPADKHYGNQLRYPLENDLSGG